MTITINTTFLYYWLFAIVFETIYLYFSAKTGWSKFKKNAERYELITIMLKTFRESSSWKLLLKSIFNPVTYFVIYLIFCFVCPLLLPFSLFGLLKKIVGYKTKLEKKAEIEQKEIEDAIIESKKWIENEGVYANDEIIEPVEPNETIIKANGGGRSPEICYPHRKQRGIYS